MGKKKRSTRIDEYALSLVRFKARQLLGQTGIRRDDLADIEQELLVTLTEALRRYDMTRAQVTTFLSIVVDSRCKDLLRRRRAFAPCLFRQYESLDEGVRDEEGNPSTRCDLVDLDTYMQATTKGAAPRPAEESKELVMDIAAVLEQLPQDLRELCLQLIHKSKVDLARELGMRRTTLYERINLIREAFREAGLDEYL